MSARIPPGFAELWLQLGLTSDPEPMFTAIGLELAAGVTATQGNTDLFLTTGWLALDNIVSADFLVGNGYVLWGNDGGDIRIDGSNTPAAGVAAANALPNNCAYLIRKLTASGGRRNRGRMFMPGIPEANVVSNGEITAAWRTTVQTAITAFQTNMIGLPELDDLVLLHETAPFTPTPITDLVLQTKIATQRRRMRR